MICNVFQHQLDFSHKLSEYVRQAVRRTPIVDMCQQPEIKYEDPDKNEFTQPHQLFVNRERQLALNKKAIRLFY